MKQKILSLLVLLLTAASGAWATVYDSGNIDLRTLNVGDILREGITLNDNTNNSDQLALEVGRYAKTFNNKTTTPTTRQSFDTDQIGAIGENGQIVDGDLGTFTPLSAAGKACTEWIVLAIEDVNIPQYSLNYKKVVVGGYRDPNIVDIDPVAGKTNEWVLDMPASNVVITPRYASATIFDADDAEKQAYETLKEAFAKVQDGDVIKLDWNVTLTEQLTTPQRNGNPIHFTLDFNGYTITDASSMGGYNCIELSNGDMMFLTDESEDKNGGLKGMVAGLQGSRIVFKGGRYDFGQGLAATNIQSMWDNYFAPNFGWQMAENKEFVNTHNGSADDDGFFVCVAWKDFELTIGSKKFDTFYLDENIKLADETPQLVGLYTITEINETRTKATATALTGVVEASLPILVYNGTEEEQTVKIKVTADEADAENQGKTPIENFQGTATDREFTDVMMAAADFYALSDGILFVPVLDPGTLGKNQCWLQFNHANGGNAPARGITLVFEESEATEITTTDVTDETDDSWYDLSGRKLDGEPTEKGVYIKSGKKVVVK